MNTYRTIVTPDKAPFYISHADRLMSIGSCFSENIGKRFALYKFKININPFGQQYNPVSVATALQKLMDGKLFSVSDLFFHDGLYHSYLHHGSFSGADELKTLERINTQLESASKDLRQADFLLLTLGTAHVFTSKETGEVVSNCHKMPSDNFIFRLLEPDEIASKLSDVLEQLKRYNSNIKFVFTISPVRYFAFGHHANSISKAHLFTALHQIQKIFSNAYYFPAYELVMDDLRDYRFFAEDMLHPNQQATDYVWQRLCETMMAKETHQRIEEIEEIIRAVNHRPRNTETEAHQKFIIKSLNKMAELKLKYGMDFATEAAAMKTSQMETNEQD